MLKNKTICLILALCSATFLSTVNAAELRGQLRGLPSASILVNCPGFGGSAAIASSGNYVVRGLPIGKNCSFLVSSRNNKKSTPVPFNTARSVTTFSGRLVEHGDKVLVLRQ